MLHDTIHIGCLIKSKLEDDGRSVQWLAERIKCNRANVYDIFKRTSIDTDLLLNICLALKYDFFLHLSEFFKNLDHALHNHS